MDNLYISEISIRYGLPKSSYLNRIPAVKYLIENQSLTLSKKVTFIMGENGTGKSTLIEGIAAAFGFNPEGGSRNFSFSTSDTHSELWQHLSLVKGRRPKDGFFLRAESFYNVATNIDDMDAIPAAAPSIKGAYGGVSLHEKSHGESFMALVQNRFFGKGLYILDEPEAALSPMRQLTLLTEIHRLAGEDSQFIIATHSPIISSCPGGEILELSEKGIRRTDYKHTEHYITSKAFFDNPERMLSLLTE